MTTTVKIEAHCSEKEEVHIRVFDNTQPKDGNHEGVTTIIQDGEEHELYIYDFIEVSVTEVKKQLTKDI